MGFGTRLSCLTLLCTKHRGMPEWGQIRDVTLHSGVRRTRTRGSSTPDTSVRARLVHSLKLRELLWFAMIRGWYLEQIVAFLFSLLAYTKYNIGEIPRRLFGAPRQPSPPPSLQAGGAGLAGRRARALHHGRAFAPPQNWQWWLADSISPSYTWLLSWSGKFGLRVGLSRWQLS